MVLEYLETSEISTTCLLRLFDGRCLRTISRPFRSIGIFMDDGYKGAMVQLRTALLHFFGSQCVWKNEGTWRRPWQKPDGYRDLPATNKNAGKTHTFIFVSIFQVPDSNLSADILVIVYGSVMFGGWSPYFNAMSRICLARKQCGALEHWIMNRNKTP